MVSHLIYNPNPRTIYNMRNYTFYFYFIKMVGKTCNSMCNGNTLICNCSSLRFHLFNMFGSMFLFKNSTYEKRYKRDGGINSFHRCCALYKFISIIFFFKNMIHI
jgi:hypothetical protein